MEEMTEETEDWTEETTELGATVADVAAVSDGMLKVTLAAEQSTVAAWIVCSNSAALQLVRTQGVRAAMKAEDRQIHPISVCWHPVLPMLLKAQVRAHCGIWSS